MKISLILKNHNTMKYRIFLFALLAVVFTSCNSGHASADQEQKVECNHDGDDANDHANAEVNANSESQTKSIVGSHDCGNCSSKSTCSDAVPSETKSHNKVEATNHEGASSDAHGSEPCTGHDH